MGWPDLVLTVLYVPEESGPDCLICAGISGVRPDLALRRESGGRPGHCCLRTRDQHRSAHAVALARFSHLLGTKKIEMMPKVNDAGIDRSASLCNITTIVVSGRETSTALPTHGHSVASGRFSYLLGTQNIEIMPNVNEAGNWPGSIVVSGRETRTTLRAAAPLKRERERERDREGEGEGGR